MRRNRQLVAIIGTVLALVLAGGMLATGAVAQGGNEGGGGYGDDLAGGGYGDDLGEAGGVTATGAGAQGGNAGGGGYGQDLDGAGDAGAVPSGGVDSGTGGRAVSLASTGAPVAAFLAVGSVLLAAGLVRPGRRNKRSQTSK